MKILVTGASGFIGKRLVLALQKDQIHVRLLSRKKLNKDTIVCDLKVDPIPDDSLMGVHTIFHLAGFLECVQVKEIRLIQKEFMEKLSERQN